MDDLSDSTSEVSVSRSLLKELVELRSLKGDKEMIQKTNQFYVGQLSQLEVKLSEYKAISQAREAEIVHLRERLNRQDYERSCRSCSEAKSVGDLEAKVVLLEEENAQMREYSGLRVEVERLKLELSHSNQVKAAYEAKFRETKVELLGLQSDRDEESCHESDRGEFELFRRQIEELERDRACSVREVEREREKVQKLEKLLLDREESERKQRQELKESRLRAADLEGQVTQLREENGRLSDLISQQWRVSTGVISPIQPTSIEPSKPPLSTRVNLDDNQFSTISSPKRSAAKPKHQLKPVCSPPVAKSQLSTLSPHSSVRGTPQPATYVPSFMRGKKTMFPTITKSGSTQDLKPRQAHLTLDDSDSDFDLSIPEEVQIYV